MQVRLRPSPASSCIQWGCDRRVVLRIHVRPLGPRWAKSGAQAYYHTARVQSGSTTCSNPYARWRRYIMLCRSRSNSKPIPSGALCDKLGKQRGCGFSTTWHSLCCAPRTSFLWKGRYYEVWLFRRPCEGLCVLACQDIKGRADATPSAGVPPGFIVDRDVSGDKMFSAYHLSLRTTGLVV